jgi:signal transduction histidine kinase
MKVLVVSAQPEAAPAWADPGGQPIEAVRLASPAHALERLGRERYDAVVIDAAFLHSGDGAPAAVAELRARARGAALLARMTAADRADGRQDLGLVDGVLPATVPAHVQSQMLFWAAEHARLGAALERQGGALHAREHELEASRARFRDVIERNADAIVVVDRSGTIRFANSVAATLFRSSREDLIGTQFGHPVVAGETTELDLWRGGDARVVEMRVVESEWEGEEARIASLRDITERRHAEEAARRLFREQAARTAAEQAAQRFRFLAEASTLLASSLDHRQTFAELAEMCVASIADWVVIYVTNERGVPQRLEAAHRDPARAELLAQLRDHPIDPRGNHPVLQVLKTRKPLLVPDVNQTELADIAQDAEHLTLLRTLGVKSFMLVPLIARDRCLGAIAFVAAESVPRFDEYDLAQVQDLALRAALAVDNSRLYREAQEANRAKTDLLAVISHDLRTPLNAIIGFAELLDMGIPEALSPATLERVGRIRASARHLLYLIDELLSFARLDAGHEEVRLHNVDARVLVNEVAAVVEPLAHQRQLHLHVDTGATPASLRTDPDKLRQILLNLASNGVKYTQDGEVRLAVRATGDEHVVLEVSDTGIGIAAEHLPHVFDPFWQVTPTRGMPDGGTGLGLSVVQRLARLLGGDVQVRSSAGQGSTFSVVLPRDPVLSSEDAGVVDCSPEAPPLAGVR